jgi:glycolate oxidase
VPPSQVAILCEKLRSTLDVPLSLHTDLDNLEDYFHDATPLSASPGAVLLAATVDDIITAVRFCSEHRLSITPRGAGTGLSGGCVPSPDALVISTEKLTSLEIDPTRLEATCGAGVITKDLIDAAEKHGLTYAPDPASFAESTLGGNVAEGAGGLRCKRYGVTKDYVIGIEAVTPRGELLCCGSFNDGRGLSIGDILIGSEGTLAIIVRIAVRLIPIPKRGTTILTAFDTPQAAAQTVADITELGIIPTVLEFLDGDAAACSNEYERSEGLDDVAAILLMETSGDRAAKQRAEIENIARHNGCCYFQVETDPEKGEQLWKIRRNLSDAISSMAKLRISEDVAVPNTCLPALVDFVSEMNRTSLLRINSFGHAGDGNIHVNFLANDTSPATRELIEESIYRLMRKTIELGGTLTGEHGIGLAKQQYLSLEFDPATLSAMKKLKSVFDPGLLLNPEKLLGKDK